MRPFVLYRSSEFHRYGDTLRWRIEDDGTLRVQVVQQRSGTFSDSDGYDGDEEADVTIDHDTWDVNVE